jgi:hypothetical protein
MLRAILIGIAIVVILTIPLGGLLYFGLKRDSHLVVGDTAPDFTLKDQEGSSVTLSEILKQHSGAIIAFYPKDFTPG